MKAKTKKPKKKSKEQMALEGAFDLLRIVYQATTEMGMNITWADEKDSDHSFENEFKKWALKHGSLVGMKLKA